MDKSCRVLRCNHDTGTRRKHVSSKQQMSPQRAIQVYLEQKGWPYDDVNLSDYEERETATHRGMAKASTSLNEFLDLQKNDLETATFKNQLLMRCFIKGETWYIGLFQSLKKQYTGQLKRLQKENDELNDKLADHSAPMIQLQKEPQDAEEQTDEKIKELESKCKQLVCDLDETKFSLAAEKSRQQVDVQAIKKLEGQIKELQAQLQQERDWNANTKQEQLDANFAKSRELQQLQESKEQAEKAVNDLKDELIKGRAEIETMKSKQDSFEKLLNDKVEVIDKLNVQKIDLEQQLSRVKQEHQDLKVEGVTADNKERQSLREQVESQKMQLNQSDEVNEILIEENEKLKTEIFKIQVEKKCLTDEISDLKTVHEILALKCKDLELHIEKSNIKKSKFMELKQALQSLRNENKALRSEFEEMAAAHDKDMTDGAETFTNVSKEEVYEHKPAVSREEHEQIIAMIKQQSQEQLIEREYELKSEFEKEKKGSSVRN